MVDSFDEIARLGRLLDTPRAARSRPAVLVRVTPGVEAHTHEFVRTGGEDSKFGFSVASGAAAEAVAALELLPSVELVGVHAHIGSQVFDVSSFEQAAEVLGRFFAPLGLARTRRGWRPRRALRQRRVGPHPGRVGRRHPGGVRPEWASIRRFGSRPSRAVPSSPRPGSRSTPSGR